MALDVRETYLRDCSVHSYFSRVLLDALSVPPLGQVFYAPRMPPILRSRKFSRKFVEQNSEIVSFWLIKGVGGMAEPLNLT